MRPREVKQSIEKLVDNPLVSPPAHLWGAPGVGKSSVVRQVAEEKEIGIIDLRAALLDPSDIRGIPIPKDGQAVWLPPSYLPTEGTGILFLDELNLAPPLVQNSCYQLVLDRRVGEYKLPDGWFVIAAGNKAEHGAFVHKMAAPLRNRFVHLEFEVNQDDWTDWAVRNQVEADVIGFIQFRPNLLFEFDPKRQEDAFPTPRSWEYVSKLLKVMPKGVVQEAIEGTVGRGAAAEFREFQRIKNELPNIDAILKGQDIVPSRTDLRYALVTALATRATTRQFERLLGYSEKLTAEFAVLLIKLISSRDRQAVLTCPSWEKFARKHKDLFA